MKTDRHIGKIFAWFTMLALPVMVQAQQDFQFSHHMFNQIIFNPGAAGSHEMFHANITTRTQWQGLEGAPTTFAGSLDVPFKLGKIRNGAGISMVRDQLGFKRDDFMSLMYALRLDAGPGKLGIGIKGGFMQIGYDLGDDSWRGYTQGSIDEISSLPSSGNDFVYDIGFGMYYKTDDVYFGLATSHIPENGWEVLGESGNQAISSNFRRHYYLSAGYRYQFPNQMFEAMPSMMLYSDGGITQEIFSALIQYNKKITAGVSYRVGSSIIGLVGLELFKDVQVTYSYDFELSRLGKFGSRSSHELSLKYCFSLSAPKEQKIYRSIRFG